MAFKIPVLLITLALPLPSAWGAACNVACRDEVAACVSTQCADLRGRAKRRCKRHECTNPIVQDCYADLAVCGATRARPAGPTSTPSSPESCTAGRPASPPPAGVTEADTTTMWCR